MKISTSSHHASPCNCYNSSSNDDQRNGCHKLSQVAPWIGLALPRMLLRLLYGENTGEINAFEEITTAGNKVDLLWGDPAFACTQLIALASTEQDWQMPENSILDIGELPAYS